MSTSIDETAVTISREDIAVVADATVIRFPLRAHECMRIARIREMLASASQLCRTLTDHTQHSLVDCQGSHATWNLAEDADAFYRALAAYGAAVKEVADEYRSVVRGAARTPAGEFPSAVLESRNAETSFPGMVA